MEIKIEVKTNSARDKVIVRDGKLFVQTKLPSKNNLANIDVIRILSKHFKVDEGRLRIIKGLKNKNKVIEVKNENTVT